MEETKEKTVAGTAPRLTDLRRLILCQTTEVNDLFVDHLIASLSDRLAATRTSRPSSVLMIAHYKGKCAVKNRALEELKPCRKRMGTPQADCRNQITNTLWAGR